jgi:hypothetical protein
VPLKQPVAVQKNNKTRNILIGVGVALAVIVVVVIAVVVVVAGGSSDAAP